MVFEKMSVFSNVHYDGEWTHFLEKYVFSGILFPVLSELYSPVDFNCGTASSFHLFTPSAYTTQGPKGLYLHGNSSA